MAPAGKYPFILMDGLLKLERAKTVMPLGSVARNTSLGPGNEFFVIGADCFAI
jgi:hypothetical protein